MKTLHPDDRSAPDSAAITRRGDAFLWAIVAEGVTDRIFGRPFAHNPYAGGIDSAEAWAWGWEEGNWILEMRGQDEVLRWLKRAA